MGTRTTDLPGAEGAEPGKVVTAFQRTFRVVPVELAYGNAVPVAVHVESQSTDTANLVALYRDRQDGLKRLHSVDGGPRWLQFTLGLDAHALAEKLDGSSLVSHVEVALLEEALGLPANSLEAMPAEEQLKDRLSAGLMLLDDRPTAEVWAQTSLLARIETNNHNVLAHPLIPLFLRDQLNTVNLSPVTGDIEKVAPALLSKLGYPVEWPATHPGHIPEELGARLRAAYPEYFTLVDDWVTERPSDVIDRTRCELSRRRAAAVAGIAEGAAIPSFRRAHLPLPASPEPLHAGISPACRASRFIVLLTTLGDRRFRLFNSLSARWSATQISLFAYEREAIPAAFCRDVERAVQVPDGWMDRPLESAGDLSGDELKHLQVDCLPVMELAYLTLGNERAVPLASRAQQPARRVRSKAASKRRAKSPPGRALPLDKLGGTAVRVSAEGVVRRKRGPRKDETPQQLLDIRRENLNLLASMPGSKGALASMLRMSRANLSHRLSGLKPLYQRDADEIVEFLALPPGWLDTAQTWVNVPESLRAQLEIWAL